ncbi:MAG: hypothetical protein Edafosvirus1_57 [Edafosvirus sp.]|uniref:Microbial-type PARG catalytic domain-containing protein n=1 Tax=Edafosvirus sp. TaxID=2487765 RepID=A0A3G4ZS35_9VIRU|nr:MAG: hypothetical protein Edafosvirus1_57 [Edafosvirus sp.]
MKKQRISVQAETLKYVEKNKSKLKSAVKKYTACTTQNTIPDLKEVKTNIEVVGMDTLGATIYFQEKLKKKFAFLVMANPTNPGGGYKDGSPAQEESICRRTNLVQCINSVKYPIPEFGGIYIRDIHIIRDHEKNKYEFFKSPYVSNCVLCCAYSNPLTKNDKLETKYRNNTKLKIEAMFNILLENGNTNIILSAFGCGAFGNPPKDMAEIFLEVINSENYKNKFENIIFAIIKDAWFANYATFTDVLTKSNNGK